ncbi:hypothetical protein RRG08_037799 [Elysia crispata]|uniref:Uncharacterized protein n=1 Tax=Elysia crispata TaxID=231223 RepID=A0AAE1BDE2_9GAST|nr:hypothetical protein RRG08_037799 [Elysia crispata]
MSIANTTVEILRRNSDKTGKVLSAILKQWSQYFGAHQWSTTKAAPAGKLAFRYDLM